MNVPNESRNVGLRPTSLSHHIYCTNVIASLRNSFAKQHREQIELLRPRSTTQEQQLPASMSSYGEDYSDEEQNYIEHGGASQGESDIEGEGSGAGESVGGNTSASRNGDHSEGDERSGSSGGLVHSQAQESTGQPFKENPSRLVSLLQSRVYEVKPKENLLVGTPIKSRLAIGMKLVQKPQLVVTSRNILTRA